MLPQAHRFVSKPVNCKPLHIFQGDVGLNLLTLHPLAVADLFGEEVRGRTSALEQLHFRAHGNDSLPFLKSRQSRVPVGQTVPVDPPRVLQLVCRVVGIDGVVSPSLIVLEAGILIDVKIGEFVGQILLGQNHDRQVVF